MLFRETILIEGIAHARRGDEEPFARKAEFGDGVPRGRGERDGGIRLFGAVVDVERAAVGHGDMVLGKGRVCGRLQGKIFLIGGGKDELRPVSFLGAGRGTAHPQEGEAREEHAEKGRRDEVFRLSLHT